MRSSGFGGSEPSSSIRRRTASSASAAWRAPESFSTTSFGVPFGAKTAFQPVNRYGSTPASFEVGTSGVAGERSGWASIRPRMVPAWICGTTVGARSHIESICPATRSFMAGPEPR